MRNRISLQKPRKQKNNTALSTVLIKLLQGFIVSDEKKHWDSLLLYQDAVREYFFTLGLSLHLSTQDGYAFLKPGSFPNSQNEIQGATEDGEAIEDLSNHLNENLEGTTQNVPTLVRRIPLSFEVSLLCILLRESLEQFDSRVSDDHRLILNRTEIYDLLKLFYEEKTDETKQTRRFDGLINRVIELGFLKELKGNQNSFEVRRIIKAQFDAEKLSEIKAQMSTELGLHPSRLTEMEQGVSA